MEFRSSSLEPDKIDRGNSQRFFGPPKLDEIDEKVEKWKRYDDQE